MDKQNLLSKHFLNGLKDYYYLINRHFPERGTLKLVGDRYRLSGDERTILYRGIADNQKAEARQKRLNGNIRNSNLIIDGYNVLFTLLNYRLGRIVFISNDNIVRDAGSLHGKLRNEKLFLESIDLLFKYLHAEKPATVNIFIDSPVSNSSCHSRLINDKITGCGLTGSCEIVKSADYHVKAHGEGIIATSDTAIIDHTNLQVTDLPGLILQKYFEADLLDLNRLL